MSELQPLELQNFPIEAHTNVRIFLLEAPPVEKFQIMYGLQWENLEFWEAITWTLYILLTSNLGCSLSAW